MSPAGTRRHGVAGSSGHPQATKPKHQAIGFGEYRETLGPVEQPGTLRRNGFITEVSGGRIYDVRRIRNGRVVRVVN